MSSVVWSPTDVGIEASQLTAFRRHCEAATGEAFPTHQAFHEFSVRSFRAFWRLFVAWSGLLVEGEIEPVCQGDDCEHAVFFPSLRLSYVENLLRTDTDVDRSHPAVTSIDESGRTVHLTRSELTDRVLALGGALRELGLAPGDRVAAIARNTTESVVACLAATALGATWSSTSPDLGLEATIERFRLISPTLLFLHGRYAHHGVVRSIGDRVAALRAAVPSLKHVISLDDVIEGADTTLAAMIATGRSLTLEQLPRLSWNHPLFVVFSSGTTGLPKCIVHGAGGTLIEHVKEHVLHGDMRPSDRMLFQTTCGWMMWNWQLSALATGASIVLYDGSVSFPETDSLWRIVDQQGVSVFGTNPTYLQFTRDAGLVPRERFAFAALRALLSTGSVLGDTLFDMVRDTVKPVPLQSVSGGTDILGCFLLGNPNLAVHRGELQGPGLGMDVRSQTRDGAPVGELVCAGSFPSRPLGFLNDPDGQRFHDAYFAQHPGFWTHGDLLEMTPTGARIHGRSDGVLNVRGIRIGPAEIYSALDGFAEVVGAMAVEQRAPDEVGGSRLVLLLVMRPGCTLDRGFALRIKRELSQRRSMVHVPSVIAQVDALPVTLNGKLSERAGRDAVNGDSVVNRASIRNPECLDALATHPALRVK